MREPPCEEMEADVWLDQSSCVDVVRDETKDVCDEAADDGRAMMGPSISSESSLPSVSSEALRLCVLASVAGSEAVTEVEIPLTHLSGAVGWANRDSGR